jgi:hypothetical protein
MWLYHARLLLTISVPIFMWLYHTRLLLTISVPIFMWLYHTRLLLTIRDFCWQYATSANNICANFHVTVSYATSADNICANFHVTVSYATSADNISANTRLFHSRTLFTICLLDAVLWFIPSHDWHHLYLYLYLCLASALYPTTVYNTCSSTRSLFHIRWLFWLSDTTAFLSVWNVWYAVWQRQTHSAVFARQQKITHVHESLFYQCTQFPQPFAITYRRTKHSRTLFWTDYVWAVYCSFPIYRTFFVN